MRIRLRSRRTPTLTGTCHPGKPSLRQIKPVRVERLDQRNLLRPPPALELLFAVDRLLNFVERFPVQQALYLILVREPFNSMELVLEDSFVQVAGHADIESSREAAHDVHAVRLSLMRHSSE